MKTTSNASPHSTDLAAASRALPVLGLFGDLIKVLNYMSAVQAARLPSVIVGDPRYQALANGYQSWQYTLWQQILLSLVNQGVVAEAAEIHQLADLGVTDQSAYRAALGAGVVPTVIGLCDAAASRIVDGGAFLPQLLAVGEQIQGADKAKVADLRKIIDELNAQFAAQEDKLTESIFAEGKQAVVTVIDVGVAVATSKDPVAPLVKGITQIGSSLIDQVRLTVQIDGTVAELVAAWTALDPATQELAAITLLVDRLKQVVHASGAIISALDDIANQWHEVCSVISAPPRAWTKTGAARVAAWAARMVRVSFAGAVGQTIVSPR